MFTWKCAYPSSVDTGYMAVISEGLVLGVQVGGPTYVDKVLASGIKLYLFMRKTTQQSIRLIFKIIELIIIHIK